MDFRRFRDKEIWLQDLLLLFIRAWLANIFLRSGLLKLFSWDSAIYLFSNEYHVPLLPPEIAAILGTAVEIGAGSLLLLGVFTRFAAIALFCLSIVIEVFVYPGTQEHYYWMMLLAVLIFFGSGRIAFSHLGHFVYCKGKFLS